MQHDQIRAHFYALISRCNLIEADEQLLQAIQNDPEILAYFPNFASWQVRQEHDAKTLLTQYLHVDYANLYVMHLVPYESFYTRKDTMIESGGDNLVRAFYEQFDFFADLEKARVVSPDHIGIELEFMYLLASAQAKAQDDAEAKLELAKIQKEFLEHHLLMWAPMFFISVKNEASTPFYHDLALLSLEFLLSDYEYICGLVNG